MIPDLVTATRYIVMFVRTVDFDIVTAKTGGSLLSWRPDDGSWIALPPSRRPRGLSADRHVLGLALRERLRQPGRHPHRRPRGMDLPVRIRRRRQYLRAGARHLRSGDQDDHPAWGAVGTFDTDNPADRPIATIDLSPRSAFPTNKNLPPTTCGRGEVSGRVRELATTSVTIR